MIIYAFITLQVRKKNERNDKLHRMSENNVSKGMLHPNV